MKLIVIPLTLLFIVSILSLTGLGSDVLGDGYINLDPAEAVYYDSGGHPVCYVANLSTVGIGEPITISKTFIIGNPDYAIFRNESGLFPTWYHLYYDTSGASDQYVNYDDLGKTTMTGTGMTIDIATSVGFFVLITGLVALAAIVGMRVFGSGTANSMVIVYGTAYGIMWGVLSAASYNLILAMSWFGSIIFLALTLIYTLGVINSFGGASSED